MCTKTLGSSLIVALIGIYNEEVMHKYITTNNAPQSLQNFAKQGTHID